jgi:hypothetical protein
MINNNFCHFSIFKKVDKKIPSKPQEKGDFNLLNSLPLRGRVGDGALFFTLSASSSLLY